MIIIKIHGGLGNQMFQYALGRNLSILHNKPFKIDSSYLRDVNQSDRSFKLDNFNTILDEATQKEINIYKGTFQKILDKIRPESKRKKFWENGNLFQPDILKKTDGYFDGYWNHEEYFKNNENIIRQDFKLKKPFDSKASEILQEINSCKNSASLHIRRTDYVSIQKIANVFNELDFNYYKKAMNIILEKYPDTHFFIFSDDINWAKENFPKKYSITFVSDPKIQDSEEIILMSLCKNNIIANSTFSWWGAWLNENPDKIVIAPEKWFRDENLNNNNKIPKTWMQI